MVTTLLLIAGLFRYLFTRVPVAYARIMTTMRDAIIITSGPSRVIDLNPAAENVLGIPLREAIGKDMGVLLPNLPEPLAGPVLPGSRYGSLPTSSDFHRRNNARWQSVLRDWKRTGNKKGNTTGIRQAPA